ncbi:MAG: hypothetical protein QG673_1686 [Pseudomonadota bacterium]|nr:hypothetical protein [Pseudomonadota bacterium]
MNEMANTSVRQHNQFVSSPYATEFTLHELKLVEYMIADCKRVDQEKIDFKMHKSYLFTPTQLAKILRTSVSRVAADADRLADEITKKRLINKQYNSACEVVNFEYITIIPVAKYSNGQFRFDFNYEILSYFINVNKNFTEFELNYLLSMSTPYAIKLYKLLYQYKTIKTRVFTIYELKEQFGISNKYPQYKDFRKRVIDPSVDQINKVTDLTVSYNEKKLGRSVDKLEFNFELKNKFEKLQYKVTTDDITTDYSNYDVYEEINNELSKNTKDLIIKYQNEKGCDYVEACIIYAKRNAKTNLDKYLADTLTKGWANVEIKKANIKKSKEIEQKKAKKQELDHKNLIKDQENAARSAIEHEWSMLSDSEQQQYIRYSDLILMKHGSNLSKFSTVDKRLYLSVFAVSNGKTYNYSFEKYILNMLGISLDIAMHS